jgi:predicted nucleic acid-binding protein
MADPPKPIAVLDTTLYVSYLITPSGPTARLVDLGLAGGAFSIATSRGLMEELRRVVTYPHIISKYTIDPKAVVALLSLSHRRAYITAGDYVVGKLDDPGDNMALACALEARFYPWPMPQCSSLPDDRALEPQTPSPSGNRRPLENDNSSPGNQGLLVPYPISGTPPRQILRPPPARGWLFRHAGETARARRSDVPTARVPRRMRWCCVPGASSRACRGILALPLRHESWGTPSQLFLSVNNPLWSELNQAVQD